MNIELTALLFFMVSVIGMTHIIVDGSIMDWFRTLVKNTFKKIGYPKFGSVVDCYLCAGTWCGFYVGYVVLTQNFWQILACGFAGGFLANFAAVLLNWLEAMTIVNLPSDENNE